MGWRTSATPCSARAVRDPRDLRLLDLVERERTIQISYRDRGWATSGGKAADLVVLSEDLFSVNRYAIHRVRPDAVVMQGRVVHGKLP